MFLAVFLLARFAVGDTNIIQPGRYWCLNGKHKALIGAWEGDALVRSWRSGPATKGLVLNKIAWALHPTFGESGLECVLKLAESGSYLGEPSSAGEGKVC